MEETATKNTKQPTVVILTPPLNLHSTAVEGKYPSKRRPLPVLKATTIRQTTTPSFPISTSQHNDQQHQQNNASFEKLHTNTLSFNFDRGSRKLAPPPPLLLIQAPSQSDAIRPYSQSRHISPVDMFNLKQHLNNGMSSALWGIALPPHPSLLPPQSSTLSFSKYMLRDEETIPGGI
ncbi:hypothetical protein HK100_011915 [Physocladia obscura]|uniref:Uncharacterized protein n=1 Tax=Physocladia obscura TaxID=109957 RepID=A0AAD5XDP8_9FUNG|nr:hypothetical protein HK100_011915 [Physocladia obscura]